MALDYVLTILYANQFYYDIYGYTSQEAEEKGFTNARFILPEADFQMIHQNLLDQVVRGKTKFQMEYRGAVSYTHLVSPYYKDTGVYEYDLEKAKQYMEAAGYVTDGSTVNFTLNMTTVDQAVKTNAATVIQFYLQQLGINLQMNFTDFPTAFSAWLTEGGTDLNFQDSDTGSVLSLIHI